MKCEQFEQRLNAVLDARQSPLSDLALQSHAEECGSCARILEASFALGELERDFQADSSFQETLDDSFSLRVVQQALLTPELQPDSRISAINRAVEAEVVEGTQDTYLELERKIQQRKFVWNSPAVLACAAALLVLVAVPIISIFSSAFDPSTDIAQGQPHSSARTNTPDSSIRGSSDSLALPNRGNFLGPAPFSTGGNIAVTLTVIPIPIEDMGFKEYIEPESIDAVMPIANSLSLLVDRIWQSIPSIRLGPISIEPPTTSIDGVERLHMA